MKSPRILCVEAYPGFRGAQRSLAALLAGLREDAASAPQLAVLCLASGRAASGRAASGRAASGRAAEGYRATGVPVHVLEPPESLQSYGGALRSASLKGLWRRLAALPAWLAWTVRLRRRLQQEGPDLVHCNQARGVLLTALAARSLGLPVVWHQRGMLDLPGSLVHLAGLLSTHVLCVSEAVRQSLPHRLRRRAEVIHNGIERPSSPPDKSILRQQLGVGGELRRRRLPPDTLLLITASSWLPYKGLHHVVDALGHLQAEHPTTAERLLWLLLGDDDQQIGKRSYGHMLQRRLDDLDLAHRVWWVGWQAEALPWLAAADLCLLPTVEQESWRDDRGRVRIIRCSEGFPRTVLEAMAMGTAVIASRVAAVDEQIVHDESGWIVPPSDAKALAEAIHQAGGDRPLRQERAAAAHQRVARFSVETMCQRTLAFWRRCLADRFTSRKEDHG